MTTLEILKEARRKIYRKKNWTTFAYAKDKNGEIINSTDPCAVCWCAIGAIHSAVPDNQAYDLEFIRDYLYKAAYILYNDRSVTTVNDKLGHAAVLKVYAAAIEKAKND